MSRGVAESSVRPNTGDTGGDMQEMYTVGSDGEVDDASVRSRVKATEPVTSDPAQASVREREPDGSADGYETPEHQDPVLENEPKEDTFRQQRLGAWQPKYGTEGTLMCYFLVAALFLPLGALMLVESEDYVKVSERYDDATDIADCPWWKSKSHGRDRCLKENCDLSSTDECASTASCGMIAKLPPHCPREFTAAAAETWSDEKLQGMGDCDPHCSGYINFTVTETMKAPVYLYYKLTNFYQNHRTFVESRSETQLAGDGSLTGTCSPIETMGGREVHGDDAFCKNQTRDTQGAPGSFECHDIPVRAPGVEEFGDFVYAPCGLPAWSRYNDTLSLSRYEADGTTKLLCDGDVEGRLAYINTYKSNVTATPVTPPPASHNCRKKHIAWGVDRKKRFQEPSGNFFTYQGISSDVAVTPFKFAQPYLMYGWYMSEPYHRLPATTDEDFIVWSKVAMLSTFQKLYRIIDEDLPPGEYRMEIKHRFDTTPFDGEKHFVLATANWTGADPFFFAIVYLTCGSISFVLCIAFAVHFIITKKSRDATLTKWTQSLDEYRSKAAQ